MKDFEFLQRQNFNEGRNVSAICYALSPTQTLGFGCGGLVPSCTQGFKSHKKTAREQE